LPWSTCAMMAILRILSIQVPTVLERNLRQLTEQQ
jgi:hypothetical protein